jgi:outer membrane protein assembly factor BamD (BamD/ComL family)
VALTLFSHADLLEYRNENEKALATLDSIRLFFTEHSIFDDVLLKKAEIRMKQGKYTDADTLLALLVRDYSDGVLADKALYMRGRLNEEQLKNPESARKFYEDLILGYPGSIYVIEARKRFRILRGDQGF